MAAIPANKPTGSQGAQYQSEMHGKSEEDLKAIVADKSLPEWYRQMAIQELASKAAEKSKDEEEEGGIGGGPPGTNGIDGGEDGDDSLASLWKLLCSGKITDAQLKKLAEKLGLTEADLAPLKGKADPSAVPGGNGTTAT